MVFLRAHTKAFNGYPAFAQYIGRPHAETPLCQRELSDEHVDDIKEWIKEAVDEHDGNLGCASLIVGQLNGTSYIVDGQHRLRAIYLFSRRHPDVEVHFEVKFQPVEVESDLVTLFQNHYKGRDITNAEIAMSSLSGKPPSEDTAEDRATRLAAQRISWMNDDIEDNPTLQHHLSLSKTTRAPFQKRSEVTEAFSKAFPLADNIRGPGDFRRLCFALSKMCEEQMTAAQLQEIQSKPLYWQQVNAETKVAKQKGMEPFWLGACGHKRY